MTKETILSSSGNIDVSVVICAYNRELTIAQTIDSVLSQKCSLKFELLIGEDFGKDRTREICIDYSKRYPEIIQVYLNEENCGPGYTWASLVKKSRGKYIASCDDDDFWHNHDKLQIQYEYMEDHKECGMIYTDTDVLDIKKNKTINNFNKKNKIQIYHGNIMDDIINEKVPICMSTTMIRKEIIDKEVPLDDYILHKYYLQDWQTWIILARYSEIHYLDMSTTTSRTGNPSVVNSKSYEIIERRYQSEVLMYQYLCEKFPDKFIYYEPGHLGYYKGILLNIAYKKFDFRSAQKYSRQMSALGINQLKIKMAKYKITFYFFAFLKYFKNTIKKE